MENNFKKLKEAKLLTRKAPCNGRLQGGAKKWGVVRGEEKGGESKLPHFLRPNITKN
ncbi:hypothetical protein ANHYDRO_01155 [Anaerococcus hydrogenalis DSM 7454]|uniref:Uncharacterized protein n=1 Tax=Anaerococcus hydrogenalis DSM 7454 TaxID=561177 RepID=B6W9A2_9FIRM|nr:hypothetical protein ANHYDRO_01155 [Anaerococcus hydrogenalis DSM 7454]